MTEAKRLNNWLRDQGISITGQVMYRLVWSESIYENRFGKFRDFTSSGLFVREVTETRRVRKYNYIHERFILEKWAPGNLTANRELPDASNGDYIPVYVFEDKKGNYLPPTERALKFILDYMNGRVDKDSEVPQELLDEKEIKYQVESMDNHPDFSTSGEARNAIAYSKGLRHIEDFKVKEKEACH